MASMLDCKNVQPRLSEYIDGAVSGDEAWNIKLHVSSCAVCERVAEELSTTANLLRALPTLEPSAGFEAALAQRLADRALQPKRPSVWARLGEWWSVPRVRPAFTTSVALAAVAPLVLMVTRNVSTPVATSTGIARSAATPSPQPPAGDSTLDELWREHTTYAASEPLADPVGMFQARSAAPTPIAATDISL
jgi:hypothetical protein